MFNFKDCIPVLTNTSHKGEMGRIGVVGGSKEDTDLTECSQWIERMHAVVIGPGLGRSKNLENTRQFRSTPSDKVEEAQKLATALGAGVTIVRKGPNDIISDGKIIIECTEEGSPRRCGGQGDLLSGTTAVFLNWFRNIASTKEIPFPVSVGAAMAACMLTRRCSKLAFAKFGRSMVTGNMLSEIQTAFTQLFGR